MTPEKESEIIGRLKAVELLVAQSLVYGLIRHAPKERYEMVQTLTEEMTKRLPELPEDSRPHAAKTVDWILKSAYNTSRQNEI